MLNLLGVIWNYKAPSWNSDLVIVTFGEEGLEMGREDEALGLEIFLTCLVGFGSVRIEHIFAVWSVARC